MSISTGLAPGLDEAVCSLADVAAARGHLTEGEARAVAVAAAAALALIHDAGEVHGRIGPAHLVLTGQGDLKLTESAATAERPSAHPAAATAERPSAHPAAATAESPSAHPAAAESPSVHPAAATTESPSAHPAAATTERPLPLPAPAGAGEAGSASPEGDVVALAATIVALATGAVLDPTVPWPADFLWRLGCPPALGADAALVLDAAGPVPTARDLGRLFSRGAESGLTLPEPVVPAVRTDPTPTMDYPPVRGPAQPAPARLR